MLTKPSPAVKPKQTASHTGVLARFLAWFEVDRLAVYGVVSLLWYEVIVGLVCFTHMGRVGRRMQAGLQMLSFSAAPRSGEAERLAEAEPVVSVCIVNWNCRDLLHACLKSLYDQPQGISFETIVVDNASEDGAAEMTEAEFPQVRLIRNFSNVGFSKANNQAAQQARGRFFFFLNNDTVVAPGTLASLTDYAVKHPRVGMIGPTLRGADGGLQINYRAKPTIAAMLHRISFLRWTCLFRQAYYRYRRGTFQRDGVPRIHTVEVLMGAAVFLPRQAFELAGRWDERYRFGGEDLDLSTQVGRRFDVVHFGKVEVLHHGRVASRENVEFSSPNVAVGYVHYFRTAGVSPWLLRFYKVLVTIDTPLQILSKYGQYLVRRTQGRTVKAAKSKLAAQGLLRFLSHELPAFWRA